jgi:hypothetical protein
MMMMMMVLIFVYHFSCNVSGSRKFARHIRNNEYSEALAIARLQVENGAQIIGKYTT